MCFRCISKTFCHIAFSSFYNFIWNIHIINLFNGDVTITNCKFNNNQIKSNYGSVIKLGLESKLYTGTVKIQYTEFNNNVAPSGVISEDSGSSVYSVEIDNCLFDGNNIKYTAQAVTEGNKRPDFLFPSEAAYHDYSFPADKLISLAAKTTCKDRWRQVINEADRLRDKTKYLCTLQQGVSPAQMDEMQEENVVLVVPRNYIKSYPEDRQERIWTISKFIAYVQEVERFDG